MCLAVSQQEFSTYRPGGTAFFLTPNLSFPPFPRGKRHALLGTCTKLGSLGRCEQRKPQGRQQNWQRIRHLVCHDDVLLAVHRHEAHAVDVLALAQHQLQVQAQGVPPGLVEGVHHQPPRPAPCTAAVWICRWPGYMKRRVHEAYISKIWTAQNGNGVSTPAFPRRMKANVT